jgi:adenosylmethionine-8-amino-7-oxononanoate aminotransferase
LPFVGDVRGRGLLAGIEFVADAGSRAALPRTAAFAETFASEALEVGLVVWPNVGQADGKNGDLAMLAPPYVITEDQIDEMMGCLGRALERTGERIGALR